MEQPTGTVTFMFTDIEGSTRLLKRLGAERYRDSLDLHCGLLRRAFERYGGYEVDVEGDSFFVAFGRAADAVSAAAEGQQALVAAEWPHGLPVRVRIGIHSGEPTVVPPKYVGLDVHKAARIMAAAHGGQVILSQSTRDLLDDGTRVRDLGEHKLKDFSGPQHLYQLRIDGLPSEFPALKTLENRGTNLPAQPTPLIGREYALAQVNGLLDRGGARLLTLTGPGGTGKTRLALQAAANAVDEFRNGVYFVSLAPISSAELVVPTIAQTLGLREQPGQSLAETLREYLAPCEMLLVLDNFEHVLDAATSVSALLAVAPDLRVLVTSRAPLRISGEHLYVVPTLNVPSRADAENLDALASSEAVRLFLARAEAVEHGFRLTRENASAVAEICVRLDGLPLAIELAAARLPVLSPQAIVGRLDQRLQLLTGGKRDGDLRHQTLQNTIRWSYDLLSPPEQRLFTRLAVFVGGCRLEAAEVLGDYDRNLGIDVLEGITSLVEKSLLRRRDDPDGQPRFWMLETIREFALEQCAASKVTEQLHAAFALSLTSLAKEAAHGVRGAKTKEWLARLDAEQDNFRDALEWLIAHDRGDQAGAVLHGLWWYWFVRGRVREWIPLAQKTLALPFGSPANFACALTEVGELLRQTGQQQAARDLKEQALAVLLHEGEGSSAEAAATLHDLGEIASVEGDLAEARSLHERSLELRQRGEHPDPRGLIHALSGLAAVELAAENLDAAERVAVRMISIGREIDEPDLGYGLITLGQINKRQGDLEAAGFAFRDALRSASRWENLHLACEALDQIARIEGEHGDPELAARLWGATEAAREHSGFVLTDADDYRKALDLAERRAPTTFLEPRTIGRTVQLEQATAEVLARRVVAYPSAT
jgi:predicted ATPase/class 3 adenylate cyclase